MFEKRFNYRFENRCVNLRLYSRQKLSPAEPRAGENVSKIATPWFTPTDDCLAWAVTNLNHLLLKPTPPTLFLFYSILRARPSTSFPPGLYVKHVHHSAATFEENILLNEIPKIRFPFGAKKSLTFLRLNANINYDVTIC